MLVERNDDCTGTLKSASSGFSTPTATSRSSRPDLLCLVAGLGVVAVEERALLGSCDRRTAVGRRDYAVIITLLWLGRRAARPRATTGANVHTVGKGTKTTIASTRSGQ